MKIKWRVYKSGDMSAKVGPLCLNILALPHKHTQAQRWLASVHWSELDRDSEHGRRRRSREEALQDAVDMACNAARDALAASRELCTLCGLKDE